MTHDDTRKRNFSHARARETLVSVRHCSSQPSPRLTSPPATRTNVAGDDMGHIHLATLPGTRRWREVVELLDAQAATGDVVAASAHAAERELGRAAQDPVLHAAVRLLAQIPQAARSESFGAKLRDLGIEAPDAPTLGDLTVATAAAIERSQVGRPRTDFDEIVRRAMVGTLSGLIGSDLPGLFGAEPVHVQQAAARLGRGTEFARTSRVFFGRLLSDTLGYWLDRTLSAEIGPTARLASMDHRDAFDHAVEQYCIEATRIIREFSVAWYGKTLHREGTISHRSAAAFTAVAMKKIGAELQRKAVDRA